MTMLALNKQLMEQTFDRRQGKQAWGRRKTDVLIAEAIERAPNAPKPPEIAFLGVKQVKMARRPRRTKVQLKQALIRAVALVRTEHQEWNKHRVLRRARSLVRTYQVV